MKEPMISIFWLNYNSSSFIDIALESLEGVLNLDYSNKELIIIDNCSTDGSFQVISDFTEKRMSTINVRVIRLRKNLGFTGGINEAYRARNPQSKYVVFLTNDSIPYAHSLKKLIEFMERNVSCGSVEGICLTYDGKNVEDAGNFISEIFTGHMLTCLSKPRYITFAYGGYSVHRVSSIKRAVGKDDAIFDDYMFAYYDDNVLGLKMWNTGSKVIAIPVITVRHKGSSSFGRIRATQAYLDARAAATLNEICNSRYKKLIKPLLFFFCIRTMLESSVFAPRQNMRDLSAALLKGFSDGVRIGREKRRFGETINMYNAPIVRLSLPVIVGLIPGIRLSKRVMTKINQNILDSLNENNRLIFRGSQATI
jgi:GT2 family glycosyltransferase